MKEIVSPLNYVEHEGEILPSYTGVNAPRYPGPRRTNDIYPDFGDNNFSTDERSHVPRDENIPGHETPQELTDEQRSIGRTAIEKLRK